MKAQYWSKSPGGVAGWHSAPQDPSSFLRLSSDSDHGSKELETQDITTLSVQWVPQAHQWLMFYNASRRKVDTNGSDAANVFCRWFTAYSVDYNQYGFLGCDPDEVYSEPGISEEDEKVFYRWASSLEGPWSDPVSVSLGGISDGFCNWVNCDNGFFYGINLLPGKFAEYDDARNVLTHYFLISTWSPYQIQLLKVDIPVPPQPYYPPELDDTLFGN